ncbi:TRM11 family SAM-dependent methyltransferase [Paraliomyxa miuraensis]|uniref:TRM11 family SAM-dependent methyltransferase n=1 Tax=Paraliomyxa miuraensis TaxID=376150 RepID=UPI002252EFF3|nr:DNA methyltransferase [Paraliomyxa miuraensis]MCX4239835.1 site-specific DNA-methyltransferase [Paraliomyxa miuraensis]
MPTRSQPPDPHPEPRRRALEHQGGAAAREGDPEVAAVLAAALESVERAERDPLTHGLHAYPARMHHAIARHVLQAWAEPRTRVLDPFCGSGTVLVEARRRGLRTAGVDLNPLALRIAEIATTWAGPSERRALADAAQRVVEASFDRVQRRVPVRAPLAAAERQWYQPHVLLELGGLHAEIEALPPGMVRRALQVVLSSIVVKFSRQRAETTEREVDKRIGKKVVTGFFARKAQELVARLAALADEAPEEGPSPRLWEGDARRLREVVGRWRFDLVLSSPPYGGTYDYADHHARRYPWLGLSAEALQRGELGARRHLSARGQDRDAARRWAEQVQAMLGSIGSVLSPRGRVVLLVGDAEVGGRRISAVRQLATLAERAELMVVASASQRRPDFLGGAPRREHLVALARAAAHQESAGPKGLEPLEPP